MNIAVLKKNSKWIEPKKDILGVLLMILIFLGASYFSHKYSSMIQEAKFLNGQFGFLFYLISTIIATVLAPFSALPLLPIAVALWGVSTAAITSIVGWLIGAIIAFLIAKRFGRPILSKFIDLDRVYSIENLISKNNLFWSVVLFRIVLPVDLLSYALGLFSKMSLGKYSLATLIGITPFAFIFAYVSELPIFFQIITVVVVAFILLSVYSRIKKVKARELNKEI